LAFWNKTKVCQHHALPEKNLPGSQTLAYLVVALVPIKKAFCHINTCSLDYKPMTIVNDDARIVNKLDATLTDDARVIIYNRHMFIVQATGNSSIQLFMAVLNDAL
jgi:hypothetical protein